MVNLLTYIYSITTKHSNQFKPRPEALSLIGMLHKMTLPYITLHNYIIVTDILGNIKTYRLPKDRDTDLW